MFAAPYDSIATSNNWLGGMYELAITLAPGPDADARLDALFRSVWTVAGVEGCFDRCGVEEPPAVTVAIAEEAVHAYRYGRVVLPNGARVVCLAIAVRSGDGGGDDLCFGIPGGVFSVASVFEDRGHFDYRSYLLDDWLVDIARRAFAITPFESALVGFEVAPIGSSDVHLIARDGELRGP